MTDDPVMGGRSHSSFVVGDDEAGNHNVGIFAGTVAIVPFLHAPGFCNAYVHFPAVDASDYDAIEITVRNRSPSLNAFKSSFGGKGVPQDPNCHHPGCGYKLGSFKAGFNLKTQSAKDSPQKVLIPFSEYTYEWSDYTGGCTDHGAVCCDETKSPNTCPSKTSTGSITQLGIWGEGTAGEFALDIFSVRAVKLTSMPNSEKCAHELEKYCDGARRASSGNCLVCVSSHKTLLSSVGKCTSEDKDSFCASGH